MAEKVVIAQLIIDETGAVRALQSTGKAVDSLGKQTHSAADVFTNRMFSMRTAAVAFLGAFTVAGAIMAFKSFMTSVYEASPAFRAFGEAAEAAKTNVLHLVGAAIDAEGSLSSLTTLMTAASTLMDRAQAAPPSALGAMWHWMWGLTPVGKINQMLSYMAAGAIGAGLASLPATPARRIPEDPTLLGAFGKQKQSMLEYIPMATRVTEKIDDMLVPLREVNDVLVEQVGGWQTLEQELSVISDENIGPMIFDDNSDAAIRMQTEFGIATGAAEQFGQAMSAAAFEGGKSFKEAMGEMMRSLAQTMLGYALASAALGALALTPWGAAVLGPPSQYFQAAAVFGAAAAGAYATASLLGAGGRSGNKGAASAGGGGGSGPAIGGAAAPNYNISFIVEGHAIVNEDWMRTQTIQLKRALADGAAGGSF